MTVQTVKQCVSILCSVRCDCADSETMRNLTGYVGNHSIDFDLEVSLIESAVSGNNTRASFGRNLAVGMILGSIVVGAILGNILVVLSVCTNRRLRTVTNFYVVSLALSDLCVSVLVMPIGIVVELTGTWTFGPVVCELWVSCDVLLCTASILNLCCISLDRYFAITKPLVYATKRSKRLALTMIAIVWVSAAVITCPPIFGWREANRHTTQQCELTKAPGYIIYSSLGSFYLPLMVMIFAYIQIFIVACRRERRFRPYYSQRSMHYTDNTGSGGGMKSGSDYHYQRRESIELGDLNDSRASTDGGAETTSSRLTMTGSGRPGKDGLEGPGSVGSGGGCSSVGSSSPSLCIGSTKLKQKSARNGGTGGCGGGAERRAGGGGGSCVTMQHANRNAFTTTHTHINHCQSDPSSYMSLNSHKQTLVITTLASNPNNATSTTTTTATTTTATTFSRSSSVCSKRRTYTISGKSERGRERAVLLKEHKAAKTLAVVVGGFIACWLPFFLMYVIEPFCTRCEFNPILATFFVWLGYFNSVMNPFIYAFYNKDFRYSFWNLTLGLVCSKK